MSYQHFLSFNQSTSANTTKNQNQIINQDQEEEEFNFLDDIPNEEEEEEPLTFNISSQIEINEGRKKEENIFEKLTKQKRFKVIKQLKRRLDKKIKRFFLKKKTFKTFDGFSKANRRIFRKLSRKVKCAEFEQLISTKIRTFFKSADNGQR